ncbi:outer mitochondrial transmembrane helix translocase isoform X1 [Tachysurus ichikawai]
MLIDISHHALLRPLSRNEVVGMLLRLTIFGAATYYGIRWVVEALDPTQRQKSDAKKRVTLTLCTLSTLDNRVHCTVHWTIEYTVQ